MFLAWYMIMSVRNILNQSQLSVFQDAQIFLNSVKTQCSIQKINTFPRHSSNSIKES